MPRIVRGLGDNIVYHVINHGNGRQEVFHKEKDYEAFMKHRVKKVACPPFWNFLKGNTPLNPLLIEGKELKSLNVGEFIL